MHFLGDGPSELQKIFSLSEAYLNDMSNEEKGFLAAWSRLKMRILCLSFYKKNEKENT